MPLVKRFELLTSPTKWKRRMPLVHNIRSSKWLSHLRSNTKDVRIELGPKLELMPYEILVQILSYLDLYDFTSARSVCRSLFRASDTLELWHTLAYSLQAQHRPLLLDKLTHPKSLLLPELKTTVLRSLYFFYNWAPLPEYRSPKLVRRERHHLHVRVEDLLPLASTYFAVNFFIAPTKDKLICLDLRTGETVEEFQMGMTCPTIIIEGDTETKSVFAAATKSFRETTRLQIIRIRLPSVNRRDDADEVFKRIVDIEMPEPLSVITMHENASARAISLLVYMLDERQTLKLYTLFDWDEVGKCCLVDTHMFLDTRMNRRESYYLRISSDLEELILINAYDSKWVQRRYSISEIKTLMASGIYDPVDGLPSVMPVEYTTKVAKIELSKQPEGYRVLRKLSYAFEINTNTYAGVPSYYSYISIYTKQAIDDAGRASAPTFVFSQHFGDENGPTARHSFIMELTDLVTVDYGGVSKVPLLCADSSHIVWVEQEVRSHPHSRTIRCVPPETLRMRMLNFPTSNVPTAANTTKTLEDIDQSVLQKAYRIILEPAIGAVLILTRSNDLYRFQYA